MDRRPVGPINSLYGTDDAMLRDFILALHRGTVPDGHKSALQVESLFVQLGTRLLFAARSRPQPELPRSSRLPHHVLRRVLELMNAELDADLSLSALAGESGYSRAHFMRMFKAAMGVTPHSHLLELRLRKAQEMVASRSATLIDIALSCGFRSHAHFTEAFHRRFGITPSFYRKTVFVR
jgi:AraC family transcriptional regulator